MRHPIQPIQGGQTYTATQFEAVIPLDTAGGLAAATGVNPFGQIRVRFYDASGNLIPGNVFPPKVADVASLQAAVAAVLAVPANAGETLQQLALRAIGPYVSTVYGVVLE